MDVSACIGTSTPLTVMTPHHKGAQMTRRACRRSDLDRASRLERALAQDIRIARCQGFAFAGRRSGCLRPQMAELDLLALGVAWAPSLSAVGAAVEGGHIGPPYEQVFKPSQREAEQRYRCSVPRYGIT